LIDGALDLIDVKPSPAQQVRTARGEIEAALDAAGWPWSRTLSRWLDCLVVLEAE